MAAQFTWFGLWVLAKGEAGITTSWEFDTAQNALAHLSEAQHALQQISNAVTTRRLTVAVDPGISADGSYAYSNDVKLPLTWQFLPSGGAQMMDVHPVTFEELDQVKRLAGQMNTTGMPVTSQRLLVAIEGSTFYIWPFQSMSGTLTLKYTPHLLPYDTSNATGDWTAYGANPLATMKTEGPAREFGAAIMGMKDFLVMKLIEDMPGGLQKFPSRYKRAEENWVRAQQFAVRDKLQNNARQLFRPHNGLMR